MLSMRRARHYLVNLWILGTGGFELAGKDAHKVKLQ